MPEGNSTTGTASCCAGYMSTYFQAQEMAYNSSSEDVTPETSTSSTEKSEVDSSGNNTFAAKKGKAEGECS